MADVINLRQKRKAKSRDEKGKQAGANRLLHGRTKAEKSLTKAETERATRAHEGHRREGGEDPEE